MRSELEQALEHLRATLESIENLESDEAEKLRQAVSEISGTLDEQSVNSADLAKRLHQQTESFQESHPVLTNTVGRIADMLSQMGI